MDKSEGNISLEKHIMDIIGYDIKTQIDKDHACFPKEHFSSNPRFSLLDRVCFKGFDERCYNWESLSGRVYYIKDEYVLILFYDMTMCFIHEGLLTHDSSDDKEYFDIKQGDYVYACVKAGDINIFEKACMVDSVDENGRCALISNTEFGVFKFNIYKKFIMPFSHNAELAKKSMDDFFSSEDSCDELFSNGLDFIDIDTKNFINAVKNKMESIKNDVKDDKLRWDLLPLEEIEDIVRVYHAGAKKYGPNRWQGLEDGYNRYKAAMLRHLMEYEKGNEIDEDTGCLHLAQVAWNAISMLYLSKRKQGVKEDNNVKYSDDSLAVLYNYFYKNKKHD